MSLLDFLGFSILFSNSPLFFNRLNWERGFTIQHWTKTVILISLMCITGATAWVIIQLNENPIVRVLTAGFAILIGYVCVKLLGENTVTAYQRAKVSSVQIYAVTSNTNAEPVASTSQDFTPIVHTIYQNVEQK